MNYLALNHNYNINYFAHNYLGQAIMPGATFEDGTKLHFTVHGAGLEAYFMDLLEPYFGMIKPEIFGVLLDSVTEERIIPVKNKREQIEFLSCKEIYEKYGQNIRGLKALSAKLKGKNVVASWEPILAFARRFVNNEPIIKITQKNGQVRTTLKHSLIRKRNEKLERITPEEFLKSNDQLVNIRKLEFFEKRYRKCKLFDFMDYLSPAIFDYDTEYIWLKYGKDIKKQPRFLDKEELKAFVMFLAAFLAEGCINAYKTNYSIIISQKNREWLQKINSYIQKCFKEKGNYTNATSGIDNLVFYSKLHYYILSEIAGKGQFDRKIPDFIYHLDKKTQFEFLDLLVEGDGHKFNRQNKSIKINHFSYCTISPKLCAGLCFLFRQLKIDFSYSYREEKKSHSFFTREKEISSFKTQIKNEIYTGWIYDFTVGNTEMFVDGCGLVLIGNTFMLYPQLLNKQIPAKSFFWFPSDGGQVLPDGQEQKIVSCEEIDRGILPLYCDSILKKFDVPVAMSRFAQRQAKKVHNMKTEYIPHAIDTNMYFPTDKMQAKQRFNVQNKFVVGSVYRNQGRKMADLQLTAFKIFAKDKPDAVFMLHADPGDRAAVFNSMDLINRLGIANKVFFTGMRYFKGFPQRQMNEVYNAMDVFFLSTSGEGFGIPTMEAQSCGIPCVVTDSTTSHELLMEDGQSGLPTGVASYIIGSWNVPRAIMDVQDAAEQLNKLYYDEKLRQRLGNNGRAKAVSIYDWKIVGKQWHELFRRMMEV